MPHDDTPPGPLAGSTSDYRAWGANEQDKDDRDNEEGEQGELLGTILVYSFWAFLSSEPPIEPNFYRGRPMVSKLDPIVWGALYAESFESLQAFERIHWRWYIYVLAFKINRMVARCFVLAR